MQKSIIIITFIQGPLQTLIMCPRWLCIVLIICLVDTVCLAVQFISLQAIILVPLLSISLLRLAPSTVYYIYALIMVKKVWCLL